MLVRIPGWPRSDPGMVKDSLRNIVINCPSLITGMSHEMRTHMNAIVAFSYLMKDSCCSNTDREEFSNQILSSCEQLIGLFDSFLDSAMIDMGNSKTDSKICKLSNMLDDLLSEFREILKREGQKDLELISCRPGFRSDRSISRQTPDFQGNPEFAPEFSQEHKIGLHKNRI